MRYSGQLGTAEQQQVSPGVWEEVLTEYKVFGTVSQRTETVEQGDSILPRYRTTTTVSVHARGLGQKNYSNLRYLTYAGRRWTVTSDQTKFPRLILYIGEEYNGPIPDGATR